MENKLLNFIWIFVGSETDTYIGEQKKYCLVEYIINQNIKDDDYSLHLSKFITKSFPWKPLDELNYADTKTVNKMINDGKNFLYKVDNDKYALISNIYGRYIFNDEENKKIKDKLQELVCALNIIK